MTTTFPRTVIEIDHDWQDEDGAQFNYVRLVEYYGNRFRVEVQDEDRRFLGASDWLSAESVAQITKASWLMTVVDLIDEPERPIECRYCGTVVGLAYDEGAEDACCCECEDAHEQSAREFWLHL